MNEYKEQKKKLGVFGMKSKRGITLIALIITIIVLLILAGVSLNAIIGENGIITNAQNAKFQTGMATLEEFIQEKYVENYDDIKDDENKVLSLINNINTSKYFYRPTVGVLQYVIDSEGHSLYLIDKSGLPEEIKEVLVGGDAGNKEYVDYASFNDVYGVTSSLKVYYCSNGIDSLVGVAKEQLDKDDPNREVFAKDSSWANSLAEYDENGDGVISADEVKGVTQLVLNSESTVKSLSDLYNLINLKEIILDGVNFKNLDGLEKMSGVYYIFFKNHCVIDDYSRLGGIRKSLQYLYLYNTTDDEVEKLCSSETGIANYDFEKLEYFAIVGNEQYINYVEDSTTIAYKLTKSENLIKNISGLSNLTETTKKSIKYLSLQCNEITDVSSLLGFENIVLLRLENNMITSLHGLEKMNKLKYLLVNHNNLGQNEKSFGVDNDADGEDDGKNELTDGLSALKGKKSLTKLLANNNKNLIWVDYLENCTSLCSLWIENCPNFSTGSVSRISKIWFAIDITAKKIDSNFETCFKAEDRLDYKNLGDSNIDDLTYMKNLSETDRKKVKKLDLSGSTLSNETLQEIIGYFPELICLNVNNCRKLSSLSFTSNTRKLEQIFFLNTLITGGEVEKLDQNTVVKSYKCNDAGIDLTKMQNTISRATYYTNSYAFDSTGNGLSGDTLIKKLENCKNVTRLWALGISGQDSNNKLQLDLGKMTALNYMRLQSSNNIEFTLSQHDFNRVEIYCGTFGVFGVTIKGTIKINFMQLNHALHDDGILNSIFLDSENQSFNVGTLEFCNCGDGNTTDYNLIEKIRNVNISNLSVAEGINLNSACWNYSDWGGTLNNITSLKVNSSSNAGNLNFLSSCTGLTELQLVNANISDITGISGLKGLTSIDLSNNRVRNLYPLKNLQNLSSLKLSNNIVDSINFYVENEIAPQNNLQILADLNLHGNLRTLYLDRNSGITDFSLIKDLTWTDRKGF